MHKIHGERRVVENIWCVGAGEQSSRLVRNANSASRKVDKSFIR